MPELPEVETTARGLRTQVLGCVIRSVTGVDWPRMLPNATPEELAQALSGKTIQGIDRRGKYLLVHLDEGSSLVFHRKMSGNLALVPSEAPFERHTHLILSMECGRDLRLIDPRKFGRVYYFREHQTLEDFIAARLGSEPLGELSQQQLKTLLVRRRGRLKPLLMNQTFLAGIGNIYADEILWAARLHPLRQANRLTTAEVARLNRAIEQVLTLAIEHRGTTFRSYVDADGLRGENQNFLHVYGRHGQPCRRCGRTLVKQVIAARGTTYCPRCQRLKPC